MGRGTRSPSPAAELGAETVRQNLRTASGGVPAWVDQPRPSPGFGVPAGRDALTAIAEIISRHDAKRAQIHPGLRGTVIVQVDDVDDVFTVYANGDVRTSIHGPFDGQGAVQISEDQVYVIAAALGSSQRVELIPGGSEGEPLARIGTRLWRVSADAALIPAF